MRKSTKFFLFVGAALGGMALVNRRIAEAYRPVFSDLDGEPGIYTWRDGVVYYRVKGNGEPMVMVHDFGAAASSYQMKPAYDRLTSDYRVYCLDWLGYGESTRPAIDYTAGAYEQLLADFIADVIAGPAIVIAAGPSAAFAARLAHRQPERVSRLVLVNPTGVERMAGTPTPRQRLLGAVLKLPVLGQFIFNLLVSKPVLEWNLKNRIFFDASQVTPRMVDYMWVTAHQPGARWAPASYWSGLLNLPIAHDLSELEQPTMIVWGQQARITPVEDIQGFKRYRPDARYRALDRTRQWPQYEAAPAFSALVRNWIQGKDKGAAAIFPGEVEPED